ncbi:hypothetical protein OOT33_11265 [Sphingobium sp. DEHP117]|nr:hypothetical protein [Sphingobium sp. DEHP117]MDQ4421006.1 hypothetical protein [Sphingobium sp. DEHP117]
MAAIDVVPAHATSVETAQGSASESVQPAEDGAAEQKGAAQDELLNPHYS